MYAVTYCIEKCNVRSSDRVGNEQQSRDNYRHIETSQVPVCLKQDGVGRGGQVVCGEGRMGECLCCVL
jgi:hypothetical protein